MSIPTIFGKILTTFSTIWCSGTPHLLQRKNKNVIPTHCLKPNKKV